jgi:phosphoserine phosphatase
MTSRTPHVLLLLGEGKSFRSNQERDDWATTRLLSMGAHDFNLLVSTPVAFIAEAQIESLDEPSTAFFKSEGFDFALIPSSRYFAKKKLIAFDLDSTLIAAEGIDEFAREMGIFEKISKITEKAMQGGLDFESSFRERVKLLEGLTLAQIDRVVDRVTLSPGVEELFKVMKKSSIQTAVLSGGFDFIVKKIQKIHPIDHLLINRFEILNGATTGNPLLPIIDGQAKKSALQKIMADQNLLPEEVIAVGDGTNDIGMIELAGIGVAYHAKKALEEHADLVLRHRPISDLTYLIR